ncbi:MAG: efflux RND transporter periplasmic adaptor subunit [Aliivibrio sp.]|uniref:efflux RND transporter periplasmic adaptor subunit n=1 Tax=Aliivibrio sp. TaxID=1872443 RepID=UPI001A49A1E5|nr:efflux RND transporter periplasmic adaptor subunit [Aliivibrio sp.]
MTRRVLLAPVIALCMSTVMLSSVSIAKGAGLTAQRSVSVYTDVVAEHQVSQTISLIGKLQSGQFVNIATEVSGKVKTIKVKANQKVKEGQTLFQLDDAKAQAALKEAAAYLANEQRKLKEYSKLVKKNAITKTAMDGQAALVDIAAARLTSAKTDVRHHHLTAPFSGTIGLIDFSRGKMVSTGVELMTLDDLSVMKLDLQVPERYLSMLSNGMKVTAVSQAWKGQQFHGEVVAIDSRINQETLNLRVRVKFSNAQNQLKPGMMMSATMAFPAISEAIIPVQALEYSGTKRFVYVVNDQHIAKRTEVILGARIDNQVLIEKGVELGDRIVVKGLVNMRDGMKVNDLAQVPTAAKETH